MKLDFSDSDFEEHHVTKKYLIEISDEECEVGSLVYVACECSKCM